MRKKGGSIHFAITYQNETISPQSSIKYLGVTLDENLSGDVMVDLIVSKNSGRLKCL